jgi:hypothetical protein
MQINSDFSCNICCLASVAQGDEAIVVFQLTPEGIVKWPD